MNPDVFSWGGRAALLFAGVITIAACGPPVVSESDAENDVPVESFEFEIGESSEGGTAFSVVEGPVEIVVGFQGLIFIEIALLAEGENLPSVMSADARVSFDARPDLDFTFRSNLVVFEPMGNGKHLCPLLQVPFGQDLSIIKDQTITLTLVLSASGWRGEASESFLIEDKEDCYEDPTGAKICEVP